MTRETAITNPVVLVVDDEQLIRWSLRTALEQRGYTVREAGHANEARKEVDKGDIGVVVLDHRLPDIQGMDLLGELTSRPGHPSIIMLTAYSSVDHAVDAMKAGAFDYVAKPFELNNVCDLVDKASAARGSVRSGRSPIETLLGDSSAMKEVKDLLYRIAISPAATVLLTGESGTGKDVAAEAVHRASSRGAGPFMNITCSAVPANLLESELFGHERGAFTDAKGRKAGLLERADGGTVFLDEIGEMSPALQAKLLRFLEQKAFKRVGGTIDVHPDVRVIAATNVDLREAVAQGAFREDLYYRIAVLTVHLPALREREGDVELLARHFARQLGQEFGRPAIHISPQALEMLAHYSWPGNVRELRNAIERAVLLAGRSSLEPQDFHLSAGTAHMAPMRLPPSGVDLRNLEKSLVKQALQRAQGNRTRAGALLGMNRDQIRYRVQKFGLDGTPVPLDEDE